jgi:hypothetical protein
MSKTPKMDRLRKEIVIHSFRSAAELCVRFGHFGAVTTRLSTDEGDYFHRVGEAQAHNDLIAFAISARRLADVGGFTKQARKQKIAEVVPLQLTPTKWKISSSVSKIDLYELLDRLVHSTVFLVVSDDFQLKHLTGKLSDDIYEGYKAALFKSEFKPILMLRTDRKPIFICSIEDVAQKAMQFLDHVSDHLSEHGVWLGNHDLELT